LTQKDKNRPQKARGIERGSKGWKKKEVRIKFPMFPKTLAISSVGASKSLKILYFITYKLAYA